MRFRWFFIAALLTTSLAWGGVADAAATSKPKCLQVDQRFVENILAGTEPGIGSLTRVAASAYRSPDFSKVFFVAISFKVAGVDTPVTGVWATNAVSGSATVMAVEGLARAFTVWPDADKTATRIARNDPSVAIAKSCLAKR